MPVITKINVPKKSPGKRAVYLDGVWGFNVSDRVAERCGLVAGMTVSAEEVEKIKGMQGQQKVVDKALAIVSKRMHSQSELEKKLVKAEYSAEQIASAVETLTRLGYLDDLRFAKAKATGAAEFRKYGKRRAGLELVKAGVEKETARQAIEAVYEVRDSGQVARELAKKKAPSLIKLGKLVAQRRLTGMLLRRGFSFEEIKPVIQEVLGDVQETVASDRVAEGKPRGQDAPATKTAKDNKAAEARSWRGEILAHHVKREKPKSKWRRR